MSEEELTAARGGGESRMTSPGEKTVVFGSLDPGLSILVLDPRSFLFLIFDPRSGERAVCPASSILDHHPWSWIVRP